MVVIGLVVPTSLKMTLDLRSEAASSKNLTMVFFVFVKVWLLLELDLLGLLCILLIFGGSQLFGR